MGARPNCTDGAVRIPRAVLNEAILAELKESSRFVTDLVASLGNSRDTIVGRLERMEARNEVHRIRPANIYSAPDRWFHGPQLDANGQPVVQTKAVNDPPHQVTVKHYPTVDGRDYLVAALFGAPRACQVQGATAA